MIKFHSFPVVSILIISGMLTSTFLLTSCQDTFSEQNKLEKLYQDEYDTVEAKDVDSDFLELLRMRQFSSQQAFLDWLREFAHANTEDALDEERSENGIRNYRNLKRITRMWAQRLRTGRGPKPKLKCDHVAKALAAVLDNFDISSRLVHIFFLKPDGTATDHSILEVQDKSSKQWEILDAYYNVFIINNMTGRRTKTEDVVLGNLDEFTPCNASGCSWNFLGDKGDAYGKAYFSAMIYDNRRTREPSQVIINQQRLPKEVSQEELLNGPYLQHIKKMLGDPKIVVR